MCVSSKAGSRFLTVVIMTQPASIYLRVQYSLKKQNIRGRENDCIGREKGREFSDIGPASQPQGWGQLALRECWFRSYITKPHGILIEHFDEADQPSNIRVERGLFSRPLFCPPTGALSIEFYPPRTSS
jgi:hypothetical protein